MKYKSKISAISLTLILGFSVFAENTGSNIPQYFPAKAQKYSDYKIGFIHGAQYWVHADATAQSIDEDFRKISQEDNINGIRLPFWGLYYYVKDKSLTEQDFKLADLCFDAADKYNIKVNPVLPQIQGWLDGSADDPNIRADYKRYVQQIIAHFKDRKSLAIWTVDIEPSRSYKVDPTPVTVALYKNWLKTRYTNLDELKKLTGFDSFESAYVVNTPSKGPWNNYQQYNDYLTFTAWALAEQTLFTANAVREIDPVHPTSCTPPDVLHNQIIENGRNMWWLADTVDYPGSQMHAHWHLETADMFEDITPGHACSIRKVYNSSRGRPASYVGEVLCGPEIAFESTRFYTPSAKLLMITDLCHLAEGVKGQFYWIWNPLKEGPIAGAWPYRNFDGTPSERSSHLANYGKMVKKHNELFYNSKPEQAPVAIFDSIDAAIYMGRRSAYQPMSEWYVKGQYGFFKALRKCQIPCDFIDEISLYDGTVNKYKAVYVPFSMTMEKDIADILAKFVENGGTIITDCMMAFTPRYHLPYPQQPGAGLDTVLGIKAREIISTFDGWTAIETTYNEKYFDRIRSRESKNQSAPLFYPNGKKSDLVGWKIMQSVEPTSAKVLLVDKDNRPICTENSFGKGKAVWTGTMLGFSCRNADTPIARYEAVAELVSKYIPKPDWSIKAGKGIICRKLTANDGDIYVVINEGDSKSSFTLNFGKKADPQELLWPDNPSWKKDWLSDSKVKGSLEGLSGCVIFCPKN